MKRLVCFSLWGDLPKYTIGAIKNAELVKKVYPGWIARFYCGGSVPADVIDQIRSTGSEVVLMDEEGSWSGMFWRFLAIGDEDVEMMLSRDTDSRVDEREASAVAAWMKSRKLFHIMRDHPWHDVKIMGGMWGVRKPLLTNIRELIGGYAKVERYQVDQDFLRDTIWPIVKSKSLIHDSFGHGRSFPTPRRELDFVGQVWDENDNVVEEHRMVISRALSERSRNWWQIKNWKRKL
jgi:hypothetical protein